MKNRASLLILILFLIRINTFSQTQTINVGGTNRTMFVYTPSGLSQNRPLVISMHGLNQDINFQRNQASWELVADTANFVVVYPAGINNSWDIGGTRDTDFISAIIESMVTQHGIDRNRVYVSGFSMGGMMSYHVANRIADKVAAIGPVAGYLFSNVTSSSRPMPIIHVHGNADDVVRYEPFNNQQGVVAMLQKWREWNQCPSTGTRVTPYPTNRPNSRSVMEYWGPCNNSAVSLITLDGKGHWHSNDNNTVHTTIELWNFLRNHSLNAATTSVALTSPLDNAVFVAPASVTLSANASTPQGSVVKVDFYLNNERIVEKYIAPYNWDVTDLPAGTYTIRAVVFDNQGNTAEDEITFRVNVPQAPYGGSPHPIPGTIQAEEFDHGGNGFAYFDDTPSSQTGVEFRTDEDVDIEICTDAGGGYNVGWATAGEWLEYTVDVTQGGFYELDLRIACDGDDRTISVSMDGSDIAADVEIPNTTGWQVWQTVTVSGIELQPGQKIMRISIGDVDYVNINFVAFNLVEAFVRAPYNGVPHLIPGRIQAQEFDFGGQGIGYNEANNNGNEGGADLRNGEVDIEVTQDVDGEYNVGYILAGEWLAYTVEVASTGLYTLDARMATVGEGKFFHIEINDEDVTGPIEVPNTDGWQVWETVSVDNIPLTAGEHVMKIVFDSDFMNLNWVEFNNLITGINRSTANNLAIYPNPFNNEGFTISQTDNFSYSITDISGVVIYTGTGEGNKKITKELDTGVYFLTLKNELQTTVHKIIKE